MENILGSDWFGIGVDTPAAATLLALV